MKIRPDVQMNSNVWDQCHEIHGIHDISYISYISYSLTLHKLPYVTLNSLMSQQCLHALVKHSPTSPGLPYCLTWILSYLLRSLWSQRLSNLPRGNALVANDMESEKELSQPPREQPVNSIENDGAINRETWKMMMDVVMAIYDYREEEYAWTLRYTMIAG